uniref:Uncharacterized protein n=1 Tax=Chelydra serpentina TaxID=8475 RepID=A0A8C3TC71_CHESE
MWVGPVPGQAGALLPGRGGGGPVPGQAGALLPGRGGGALSRGRQGGPVTRERWGGPVPGQAGPCYQGEVGGPCHTGAREALSGNFSSRPPSPALPGWHPQPCTCSVPASGPGSRCLSPADWQVSQHLQQASRAHEAESSHLSQQVSTKGATLEQMARELEQARRELEQTRRELEQARRELEQLRQEGNSTQEQLRQREAELKGTKEQLARVQEEKREIKENISPPLPPGCCPADWVLYRGKCLFVSKEEKRWEESKEDCESNSARLLITKSWDWWTMPVRYMHSGCDRSQNTLLGTASSLRLLLFLPQDPACCFSESVEICLSDVQCPCFAVLVSSFP